MVKIELTEQQFETLSQKKLADVVDLISVVKHLTIQNPQYAAFLEGFLTNKAVEIIYNGGSKPGSQRKIIPQSIKADGSFRAFCVDSDTSKAFKLEQVKLI